MAEAVTPSELEQRIENAVLKNNVYMIAEMQKMFKGLSKEIKPIIDEQRRMELRLRAVESNFVTRDDINVINDTMSSMQETLKPFTQIRKSTWKWAVLLVFSTGFITAQVDHIKSFLHLGN